MIFRIYFQPKKFNLIWKIFDWMTYVFETSWEGEHCSVRLEIMKRSCRQRMFWRDYCATKMFSFVTLHCD